LGERPFPHKSNFKAYLEIKRNDEEEAKKIIPPATEEKKEEPKDIPPPNEEGKKEQTTSAWGHQNVRKFSSFLLFTIYCVIVFLVVNN